MAVTLKAASAVPVRKPPHLEGSLSTWRGLCSCTEKPVPEGQPPYLGVRHFYLESSLGGFVVHEVAHETHTITNAVEASRVRSLK